MSLRRTYHALYDTKYHLVWTPKHRRWIDRVGIRDRIEEIFLEVASAHQMEIDRMDVLADNVHIFFVFTGFIDSKGGRDVEEYIGVGNI